MEAMNIPHDNPHHTLSVSDHCEEAAGIAIDSGFNMDIQVAALIHDIGKPYTKAFKDGKGNSSEVAHFYSHDNVGAWMAYGLMVDPFVVWLISTHMDPFLNTKYYNKLPVCLKKQVDLLHEADLAAH